MAGSYSSKHLFTFSFDLYQFFGKLYVLLNITETYYQTKQYTALKVRKYGDATHVEGRTGWTYVVCERVRKEVGHRNAPASEKNPIIKTQTEPQYENLASEVEIRNQEVADQSSCFSCSICNAEVRIIS